MSIPKNALCGRAIVKPSLKPGDQFQAGVLKTNHNPQTVFNLIKKRTCWQAALTGWLMS
jgi:hypothetical protein